MHPGEGVLGYSEKKKVNPEEELMNEEAVQSMADEAALSARLENNFAYWANMLVHEGRMTEDGEISKHHRDELIQGNFSPLMLKDIQRYQRDRVGLPSNEIPQDVTQAVDMTKRPG